MLPDGFDTNYYTEIFVRLDQNDRIYSDVYKKKIEDLKTWAEPIAEQEAQNRYDSLKADAQQKVDDAQKGAAGSDGGCAYRSGRGEAEADRRAKRACRRQRADRGRKKAAAAGKTDACAEADGT